MNNKWHFLTLLLFAFRMNGEGTVFIAVFLFMSGEYPIKSWQGVPHPADKGGGGVGVPLSPDLGYKLLPLATNQ